ncbi:DsbA family protein [Cytophaga aurantiaca]|uniref:DsbA family protein n=1 Tax=Cytophaga aurantiaca TaxID=29530 RepID=UPI001FE00F9B|nr:DsbA family protein [Cytophaga aurantiaca]
MKLIYIYDPLCGWCYGFGPVAEKIEQNYSETVDLEIISGGMIMGDRIAPVGNMAEYILSAIPRLQKTTGVTFGAPYIELLKEGTYVTSSEKPSVALCVYKSFKADRRVEFAHSIQKSFFVEAKDLNQDSVYANIAAKFGIDREQFLTRMQEPEYLKQAHAEFKRAADLGVTGFPTLLQKQQTGYVKLSEGYTSYESIEKHLQKQLKSEGAQ